ncbi:hypothetical protein LOAG_09528 [Loa loa]|uniref:Pectate lyase n=1 Tax=Loa loa TaxID=7209 RepID=A0A1I7VWM3_LOALO|nr:hypothetical protein LOAG_09528 [Loa loa]EFO18968.1 hypothetical protein LOAG_09528 [Loa loa]
MTVGAYRKKRTGGRSRDDSTVLNVVDKYKYDGTITVNGNQHNDDDEYKSTVVAVGHTKALQTTTAYRFCVCVLTSRQTSAYTPKW